jgi:two-component system, cell cycle response regulator
MKALRATTHPARLLTARRLTALAACLLLAQWAHALLQFGGRGTADFFGRWVYDAIVVISGLACISRALTEECARAAWGVLGAGLLSFGAGDLIYSMAPNLDAVPVPSISDPLWLAFYPCAYVTLLLLARARTGELLAATRLDGLISGVTTAAVLACVTLPTALANGAGGSFAEQATNVAYPVADLVLLGAVVSAVALSGWRVDRALGTLGVAMLAWEAADMMYLFGVNGTLGDTADALVLTGAVGMAWAATIDRRPASRRVRTERGLFVPVVFGAGALVVLIVGIATKLTPVGLTLAAAALALTLLRMALALAENRSLLGESRLQATTDPLTGLGNRRKLKRDLTDAFDRFIGSPQQVLVLLDLNGFKTYNDSFGHAAGDALLAQLGASLADAVRGRGEAYRLGGDEFCVMAPCTSDGADALSEMCATALSARGNGFAIDAAHGTVMLQAEAADASTALALADTRMYQNKAGGRVPTADQLARVLIAVVEEHAPQLAARHSAVRELALRTAKLLDLPEEELDALRHAAALHDIGKMAIPESILGKPGPLSHSEWELVRSHPVVGERILAAAPALAHSAHLVRSSHERADGRGYPDALHLDDIPLGARIISVVSAYDAMISSRPHRAARSHADAVAELVRCKGTQFDPHVVDAFAEALELGAYGAEGALVRYSS